MRRASVMVSAALALLLALPALAAAAGGPPDRARAERALQRVQDLKQGVGVRTGRELTAALAELARQQQALDSAGRRTAAGLLARPTDNPDPQGDAYSVAEATPYCLSSFCVHYVTTTTDAPPATDGDGDGVRDYVELMATVFENEVMPCENGIAALGCAEAGATGLGWPAAPSDGTRGGGPKIDVYLKQLGSQGIFGYVAPDPGQSGSSRSSYLVMDNDYVEFGYPDPADPLRVTAAHEYNHVLQFGIETFQDTWMFESTATWAEEKVYPSIDDYLFYLGDWVELTEQPLTDAPNDDNGTMGVREDLKIYGSAVWNHWLSHRHGDDVILEAWEASTDGGGGPIATGSYETAIVGDGGVGFSREFELFSTAVAEWRAPGSGLPDNSVYPDVPVSERPNLTTGGAATSITLDHTTFALRNIAPPASPRTLTLNASLPAGLDGAIALVGRTGTSTTGGTVEKAIQHVTNGGPVSVSLSNANNYGRITAVFVNSDVTQTGWHNGRQDWNWSRDNQIFSSITVTAGAAPNATTGAATAVTATGATLNGSLNPNGGATTYYFQYGTTTAYGSQIPAIPASAGSGNSAVPVSVPVTGLALGTTYHYRLVAQSAGGTTFGENQTFTTLAPPGTTTGSADPIGLDTATLNATVNPRGKATTYHFEYGPTASYGTQVPLTPVSAGSGTTSVAVSQGITGLTRGTTYHFRVVATNADGTTMGGDQTFTTKDPPIVVTGVASAVEATTATLNATVDPQGRATTYRFEYGTTDAYGSQTPSVSAGAGLDPVPASTSLTGLTQATTYHFRVVATSADGTVVGADQTFTTRDAPVGVGTGDQGTGVEPVALAPDGSGGQTPTPIVTTVLAVPLAPTIALVVPKQRLRTVLAKGLRVRAGCGSECSMTLRLRLPTRLAKRLKLRPVVATATRRVAAGQTPLLTLKFGRRARRALGRMRSVRFTLSVAAVDSAGRRAQLRRAVTVRR